MIPLGVLGSGVFPEWTPAALPGLLGWWDASDPSTLTIENGGVTEWRDKAGGIGDFTATGEPVPLGTLGGLPAIHVGESTMSAPTLLSGFSPSTSAAAYRVVAPAETRFTVRAGVRHPYPNGAWFQAYGGSLVKTVIPVGPQSFRSVIINDGPDSVVRANGTDRSGDLGSIGFEQRVFDIGQVTGGRHSEGLVGEVVFVSERLSPGNIYLLDAYLQEKWGI